MIPLHDIQREYALAEAEACDASAKAARLHAAIHLCPDNDSGSTSAAEASAKSAEMYTTLAMQWRAHASQCKGG